jgi:hypothetical protein
MLINLLTRHKLDTRSANPISGVTEIMELERNAGSMTPSTEAIRIQIEHELGFIKIVLQIQNCGDVKRLLDLESYLIRASSNK